jgi:catalase-peroxidase
MGLIYVNPEGPEGNPDPLAAARAIREAFGRMAMNDEETAALIAGGHTFGKAHGAAKAAQYVGAEPEGGSIEQQGFGWKNSYGTGKGGDTITSGLEGAWTSKPAAWTHDYLVNLYTYEWEQTRSPSGAVQWKPARGAASALVPDAHDPSIRHAPMMFTTDLALKVDPAYKAITSRWLENPKEFEAAFARAWFKLTHRDLGPTSRYLGNLVPNQEFLWQDPIPKVDHTLIDSQDAAALKAKILDSGLSTAELVRTAWASASTFRGTDMRGGANGARIRLAPQKDWAANDPAELDRVLKTLEKIRSDFNGAQSGGKRVSLADLIVLGGAAGIEQAAKKAGVDVSVSFVPGRMDASVEQTDVDSFALLEPTADGFRNYFASGNTLSPAEMLVEKAALLNLTIPEMTVLVGGMRAMGANAGGSAHGVFTDRPGALTNDFFVELIDMSTQWTKSSTEGVYEGRDRATGQLKWTATPVDLIFGSNSELRAVAEFYAADDAQKQFARDFIEAWTKVMTLDRFDLE